MAKPAEGEPVLMKIEDEGQLGAVGGRGVSVGEPVWVEGTNCG